MDFFTAVPLLVAQRNPGVAAELEYSCLDGHGRQVAHAREEPVSGGRSVARALLPAVAGRRVRIGDMLGRPLLVVDKRQSWMTATTTVSRPDGRPVGSVEKDPKFFRAGFALLDPWKQRIGSIEGDLLLNNHFVVDDGEGREAARIDRTRSPYADGLVPPDAYRLVRHYSALPEPLNTLILASVIAIDLTLHPEG